MKKSILLFVLILLLAVVPLIVFSQTEITYPSLPGVVSPQEFLREAETQEEILPLFINYIFHLFLVASVAVALGVILYGGFLHITSAGDPEKRKSAKSWILSAMHGALIVFASYALLFTLDSQLVLFQQRDLDDPDRMDRLDLDWEIKNIYFQIPFGLLVEDAILNETAQNKLYDVLDATYEAEDSADAIEEGSKQLLALVESCPEGDPCYDEGPIDSPPIDVDEREKPDRFDGFRIDTPWWDLDDDDDDDFIDSPWWDLDDDDDDFIDSPWWDRDDDDDDFIDTPWWDRDDDDDDDFIDSPWWDRDDDDDDFTDPPWWDLDDYDDDFTDPPWRENETEAPSSPSSDFVGEEGYLLEPGVEYTITSELGEWRGSGGIWDHHQGVDITAAGNVSILSSHGGEVVSVLSLDSSRGNTVVVLHTDEDGNNYLILYQHLDSYTVETGDFIDAGLSIGKMGSTGAGGHHLHYEVRKISEEEADQAREGNISLGAGEAVDPFKEGFLDRDLLNAPTLLGKSLSSLFASFFELFKVGYIGAADYIIDMPDMDDWLDGDETGNDIEEHIVLPPNGDSGGDVDSDDPEGAFQDVSGANGDEGAHATSETQEGYYTEEGGGTITDEDGNEYNVDEGGGTITDEDGNEYNVDEDGNITDEDGNEYVMDEDGNIVPVDEEEEEEVVVCTRCPEIQPPIAGKIGEIEGYMATFRARLGNLFDTKEPLEEDLYQLHKATMIKTLGKESIIDYTSLILQRRYYERDEIVIRSDTSRTEIGNYFWDWGQWIHNILYRVRANGKIIEENDPVTFYLRDQDPRTSTVIADATTLSLGAQMEGIQDAGEQMGVSRIIPPPPPDIGTTLYSPVNPDNTRITSPYGWRTDPFTGEGTMHYGIDFAGPRGTPIYASEDGEVVFAGWSGTETSGYGKLLVLYHEATEENDLNQDIVTYYAHLDHNSLQVDEGDSVRRGDYIAGMGTTGRSTGYHLHYEVRTGVSYPYIFPTGDQVNPAPYIDIEQWSLADSSSFAKNDDEKSSLLQSLLKRVCIGSVSAQSDLEILNEYLIENNIDPRDLTEDEFNEILDELGILPDDISVFSPGDVDVKRPRDYLVCGMEIPVGETLELTWNHLVKILDTIDYYIAEGERMLQQQATMNSLAASCECPCGGSDPDCPGRCQLNCPLGAIAAAHANVAATREVLREIADYIRLLTHGHFNTPTEDVCHYLNEDIRSEEEETICQGGGSKLITNHELITRKLNYSRYSLDECITRPEHLEDVLEGTRAGKIPLFGPIVEKQMLPRYTKTKENGIVVNTSDLNWFCCSDERLEDK